MYLIWVTMNTRRNNNWIETNISTTGLMERQNATDHKIKTFRKCATLFPRGLDWQIIAAGRGKQEKVFSSSSTLMITKLTPRGQRT